VATLSSDALRDLSTIRNDFKIASNLGCVNYFTKCYR